MVGTLELQLKQYLTLLELSRGVASHRDLPDLLHDLAGQLRNLFHFHKVSVLLHDGATNVMRLHFLETAEPALPQLPCEVSIEGSAAGWVWQTQEPLVSGDIAAETRFHASKVLGDHLVKSVCILPMSSAHHRLGVLCFASDRPEAYAEMDLDFAMLVAAQVAVAMEAHCYQQKLARERDRSQLLLEVNNMLVSNLNLRELLSAISGCLQKVLPHDLATLALYDRDTNTLRATALEFPTQEDLFIENEIIQLDVGPAGQAFTTRRPVVITDLSNVDTLGP
ncbi:MAG TPA: GAF domain-containing protein, partial [Blastocatellia bacterium]|nr:GAF domain-containing protein [Blastocatellia bacterium]